MILPWTATWSSFIRRLSKPEQVRLPICACWRLNSQPAPHRVRHAPVVVDGGLRGIVSIGDVVKNRIDELETERAHLTNYITGTR